jgi:S-adenosylmethionine hydrolase
MIVTLLTDFGTSDYFVAAIKGVVLSKAPTVALVDISHEIAPHDIRAAAFLLLGAHRNFPKGTIHLVVVDPGVGSDRRPIVLAAGDQFFVGPDNGVFDMILERETGAVARRIENPALIAPDASNTFHGRDIFAPAAAALATGMPFDDVGEIVEKPVRYRWLVNHRGDPGHLEGSILHVDRFGNCVTSFEPKEFNEGDEFYLSVGGQTAREMRSFYARGEGAAPFIVLGSAGFYEISVNRGSDAELLGIQAGDRVVAQSKDGRPTASR